MQKGEGLQCDMKKKSPKKAPIAANYNQDLGKTWDSIVTSLFVDDLVDFDK